MTVFEKLKLQEAYQKVLNESWGDIINAGYSSMAMGSPFAPRPYRPGTSELKSAKELQQEQKNTAIAGAAGLAAGAAVLNPAAAATAGKYALNAWSGYDLMQDICNNHPDAANLTVALAASNPKMAANIGKRFLNSRLGWVPGVIYPVVNGVVHGYYDGVNSQSSDNQSPPKVDQPPPSDNQQQTTIDADEANLAKWNEVIWNADRTGFPISNDGTNNVVDKVGVNWVKNKDYVKRFPDLYNVVNGKITRDMKK